jgi:hypothetical protein
VTEKQRTRRRRKRAFWRCPDCGTLVPREQQRCRCGVDKSERTRFSYQDTEPKWRDTWLGIVVVAAMVVLALSLLRGCDAGDGEALSRLGGSAAAHHGS